MHLKIGCHVSIAGGLVNAPKNAAELGCETFQMFTRSPQGGPVPKLTDEAVALFKTGMQEHGFTDFVIHAPYIINFGSAKPSTLHGSINIIRTELERGSLLGASYVMFHPGSFKDLGEVEGMKQVKKALSEVLQDYKGVTKLLIEISAGAGQVIGDTFEELAELVDVLKKYKGFGGICYDTQHAFASGYDIRTQLAVTDTFRKFGDVIGFKWFRMSHVNDSKPEFASHKDRHEHIGEGKIGIKGFKEFMAGLAEVEKHGGFAKEQFFPLILETEHDKVQIDIEILKKLRNKL
jgi:deoxyribonuclease IV